MKCVSQGSDFVVNLVLRQGWVLAMSGVASGTIGAYWLTKSLLTLNFDPTMTDTVLFGVSPTDPATFGVVAALILAVALFACYRPARRASGVDPMIALRHE